MIRHDTTPYSPPLPSDTKPSTAAAAPTVRVGSFQGSVSMFTILYDDLVLVLVLVLAPALVHTAAAGRAGQGQACKQYYVLYCTVLTWYHTSTDYL